MAVLSTQRVPDVEQRRECRHLAHANVAQLIEVTGIDREQTGLTGEQRALLFLTTGDTRLRASELASLTLASFDFEADPAIVTVKQPAR